MQAINRTSNTQKPAGKKSQLMNAAAMLLAAGLCLAATSAQAAPIVIQDNYIGGEPTDPSLSGQDIVGRATGFEVSKMAVSFTSANTMIVDVYSRYFDNIGLYDTQLGDLFISTDGYDKDGEDWEYALKLDDHLPNRTTLSGEIFLYRVLNTETETNIIYSNAPSGSTYRVGEEVQYTGNGQDALATGTWSLNNIGRRDKDDFLHFTIAYDFGDVDTYGLHWGMTCGNDVIEGAAAAPVPEPSAMLLFGTGLLGLGGALRQRMQPNNDIRIK